MAVPTFAEARAKLVAAVDLYDELWKAAQTNATNLMTLFETYETTTKADGEQAARASAAVNTYRATIASALRNCSSTFTPLLELMVQSSAIGKKPKDPQLMLDDIYDYMYANSISVQTRVWTRGSFTAGSVTGTGTVERVTKDESNLDMEASHAEAILCTVEEDQNVGGRFPGREVWTLQGKAFVDEIEWGRSGRGSGLFVRIAAVNASDSKLQNPSFGTQNLSGNTIAGWSANVTINTTNFTTDTTYYYQADANEGSAPAALKVNATATLTQYLQGTGANATYSARFNADYKKPVHASVAYNVEQYVGVGTLVLALGSKSVTVYVNGVAPTLAAGAAGSVDAGAHLYVVSFVVSGTETNYGPSATITASGSTKIELTAIPLGPTGTTARKVYRTVAAGSTYKLLTTISDNTTTTYSDNTVDASLGATATVSSGAGWQILKLPTTNQSDLWPKNWNSADAVYSLAWTKVAGSILLDRCMLLPYVPIPNRAGQPSTFILFLSGRTAWKRNDYGTITDSCTDSVIQRWMDRAYGRYLPHSGSPSISDP